MTNKPRKIRRRRSYTVGEFGPRPVDVHVGGRVTGLGVTQDYAKAVGWWRKAAKQGNAKAQFVLGTMYNNGQGVTQDCAKAVQWYRTAAEQGYARAQWALGNMYGVGQGVPRDDVQAHVWFNIAVSKLPPGELRDQAVDGRDIVAERMTPAQLSEAQKLAREWKPKE